MPKTGRNDPCPCGSGKKYKKCCLLNDVVAPQPEGHWLDAEAGAIYQEAMELDTLSNSVIDLIKARRFPEAEAACKKLQKQFPDCVDGYERSVLVFKAKGDYKRAALYARKAIEFMQARAEEYDPGLIEEMQEELRQLEAHGVAPVQTQVKQKTTPLFSHEDDNDDGDNDEEEEYWWQRLAALPLAERYETVLRTLKEELTPEFLAEVDLIEALLSLKSELLRDGYVAEAVHLARHARAHLPGEIYAKEYEYFDGILVDWALFNRDPRAVEESLSNYLANPVRGIDSMIPLLNKLCYYGWTEQAVLLSQETFDPVNDSPDLIGGAAWELAHCLYFARLGWIDEQHRQGAVIDWGSLAGEMDRYGIEIDQELLERLRIGLTGGPLDGARIAETFGRRRDQELTHLAFGFLHYMHDGKNMNFPCGELIWRLVLDFLLDRKLPAKGVLPDAFFRLTRKELEPHLAQMIGGFLSRRQADAVAMLWGIPYIYDFLLDSQVISGTVHDEAGKIVAKLKTEFIKEDARRLWEYDFVHRWTPPASISQSGFDEEAKVFQRSCTAVVPLAKSRGGRR